MSGTTSLDLVQNFFLCGKNLMYKKDSSPKLVLEILGMRLNFFHIFIKTKGKIYLLVCMNSLILRDMDELDGLIIMNIFCTCTL